MAKNKGGKNGGPKSGQEMRQGTGPETGHEPRNPPKKPGRKQRLATSLVTAGRDPRSNHGFVNPPVYHASTVLYPSAEDFLAHRASYQ